MIKQGFEEYLKKWVFFNGVCLKGVCGRRTGCMSFWGLKMVEKLKGVE